MKIELQYVSALEFMDDLSLAEASHETVNNLLDEGINYEDHPELYWDTNLDTMFW